VDTDGCEYWPTCRARANIETTITISTKYLTGATLVSNTIKLKLLEKTADLVKAYEHTAKKYFFLKADETKLAKVADFHKTTYLDDGTTGFLKTADITPTKESEMVKIY